MHHSTLISRSCPWASMERGGCKFRGIKTGAEKGAVVSQLVPKLNESVPWGGYSTQSKVSTVKLIEKGVVVNLHTEGAVTVP